jgi:prephenate dehydrogenase
MFNTVTIVGVGLISGSFALGLKDRNLAKHIIGVSRTEASIQNELGLIDESLKSRTEKRSNICSHTG